MPHDHAQSERDRQQYEWRSALTSRDQWKAEALMATAALREINATGVGLVEQGRIRDIAQLTLESVESLRKAQNR